MVWHGFWLARSISAFGFVISDILSSPRMVFAFGRDGALPQFFAHVHPRYRSPDVAIITYAALAFVLSISVLEKLAVLSNVAVLLMYLLCCAACWFLVQRDVRSDGEPFNFPGMKILLALVILCYCLDSGSRHSARIPRDWNWYWCCRLFLALCTENRRASRGYKSATWRTVVGQALRLPSHWLGRRSARLTGVYSRRASDVCTNAALVLPSCAIIIWRSIICLLRFPSVSTDDKDKEKLVECADWW